MKQIEPRTKHRTNLKMTSDNLVAIHRRRHLLIRRQKTLEKTKERRIVETTGEMTAETIEKTTEETNERGHDRDRRAARREAPKSDRDRSRLDQSSLRFTPLKPVVAVAAAAKNDTNSFDSSGFFLSF
jgi:hypothetical protein